MDAYPPNSRRAAEPARPSAPQPHVEQVTTAEAHKRKKGVGKQFKDTFLAGDLRGTTHHVFLDVMVPAVRDLMVNSAIETFEGLIYGDRGRGGGRRMTGGGGGYSNLGHVPYNRMSGTAGRQQQQPEQGRSMSQRSRQSHSFGDIEVESRLEAETVLDRMYDLLDRYEVVTVANLYTLTGIRPEFTDQKWGWTSLKGATSRRTRSGNYVIDLPDPQHLE